MGKFEKSISIGLCVISILCGVLLAVLGFGESGEPMLFLGALLFISVPAVMLFGMFGGEISAKSSRDPMGIVVGAAMILVSGGAVLCMAMLDMLKEAGAWLAVPADMFAAGVYAVVKALRKQK